MSELTPPSASPEALLFSQPVTLSSTKGPLGVVDLASRMATSPAAAWRKIAFRAVPLMMPALPSPLVVRAEEPLLLLADGVALAIRPAPFTTPMVRSPSLSALTPPLLLAAGPRGAFRGLWLRAAAVGAGIL